MLVAAFQFDVRVGRVEENLAAVLDGLREAARAGCALVCLPEMWPTSFAAVSDPERRAELVAETERAFERVERLSEELGLVVAGSGFGARGDGALPANRLRVHDRGALALAWDKVHLFSPTAEPAAFSAGDEPPRAATTSVGRVAGLVCYDLRFGEVARAAAACEPDVLVVPAQWPSPRETHWRALVLGRAVECQCPVVAANRTGTERVGRRARALAFPGNSLVADAHGRALAEGSGREGLVAAELDPAEARRLRVRVPVRKDRREGLYAAWREVPGAP